MGKIVIFAMTTLILGINLSLVQGEDAMTITTYYPSPFGVYKNLRIFPNDDFTPGNSCVNEGEMYYDNSEHTLEICSDGFWKPAPGAGASVPSGAIMFFDLDSCPSGWSALTAGRGRYLVGLLPGGTKGGQAGNAFTIDKEDRPAGKHGHTVSDPGHYHFISGGAPIVWPPETVQMIDYQWGSLPESPVRAVTGVTVNDAGSVAGTNAPYVQFLVCQKD